MTHTSVSKMVGYQEVDGSLLFLTNASPTKGRSKSCRSSPRGKPHDNQEWEKNRVRFGSCCSISPKGSPNGKTKGSPSKSPRQSPVYADLYAGFSDSPAPAALPTPPSHWMMNPIRILTARESCHQQAVGFANSIKVLLNVQA